MKNLWKFLLIPALLFSFSIFPVTVNSAEIFSITAPDVSVNNNRLFQVDIFANTNTSFSAGTFIITYDNNLIEYRGVSTNMSTAICKAVDNKDTTKAIFLNTEKSFDSNTPIFSFKAKSLNYGNCTIKIQAKDLVDNNGNSLALTHATQATVSIDKNSSGGIVTDDDTIENKDDNKPTKESKETETATTVEVETKNAMDFSGEDNSINMFFVYIIIFMLIVIVALIFICFYNMQAIKAIAKHTTQQSSQKDNDSK